MEALYVIMGVVVGAVLTYFLTSKLKTETKDLRPELDLLQLKITDFNGKIASLETTNNLLSIDLEDKKNKLELTLDQLQKANTNVTKLTENLREMGDMKSELQDTSKQLEQTLQIKSRLEERLTAQDELLLESKQVREKLSEEFKNIANEVIVANNTKFSNETSEKITGTLTPFKERLKEFQETVEKIREAEVREATDLKKEIQTIKELNEKLSLDANNLANALKTDVKKVGNWGELVLERILEASGLRKPSEYILQGSQMDLRNDDGGLQKPDAIIMLPENKHLIVDSKVSLKSFEAYHSAHNESEKDEALKSFKKSVEEHIKDLASKKYYFIDKLISPDFVFLFMPTEGAYYLWVSSGGDTIKTAKERNICIVSPTTLIPTLKTVATIWRHDRQNKNAAMIAKLAGDVHDKFAILEEYIDKLDDSIDKSRKNFEEFKKRLTTGKGNVVRSLNNLKVLGAKTGKIIEMDYDDPDKPILAEAIEQNADLFEDANSDNDEELLK